MDASGINYEAAVDDTSSYLIRDSYSDTDQVRIKLLAEMLFAL